MNKFKYSEEALDEDMSSLNLRDILDVESIQLLMDNFYDLTHIPMSIIDMEGKILVTVGWQDICAKFHRIHPETSKNCIKSDTELSTGIPKGEYRKYICCNNMWHIGTPIIVGNKKLGNLFLSQFIFEDEQPNYELFRRQARKYSFNEEEYIKALSDVPRFSIETVNKSMAFFTKLADIISQMSYNNFKLNKSLNETEKLMEALKLTQTSVDMAADGILWITPEGKIFYANNAICKRLQYSKDEIQQKYVWDFDPLYSENIWHEHWKKIEKMGSFTIESIHQSKDGKGYPVEISVNYVKSGGNEFNFAYIKDITERIKREEEVFKAKEEWEYTFDAVPDLIAIVDKNYNILRVNQAMANRLSVKAEDCTDCKCYKLIHGTAEPPLICPHKYMLEDGQEHTLESHEDELNGDFLNTSSPIYNEKKEIIASVHVLRDITQRKKAEKELKKTMEDLKRSNRELEQFAYVASHDLQEPLRMVSSFTQLLEMKYKDELDAEALEYINFAVDGAKRMQDLINDLLAYSRVETKGGKFEDVDLEKVMDEVLFNLEITIEDNSAVITRETLPHIYANYRQMVQLFQNLIGNAIKYRSQETPKIYISTKKENKHWLFSVEDNGIGIDNEHQKKVFEIFERLQTREEYPGTGIGLAICKKIVERHGGKIWVESKPGKSSTFYFTITK